MLHEHWLYDSQMHVIQSKFRDIPNIVFLGWTIIIFYLEAEVTVAALYYGDRHYRVLLRQLLSLIIEFLFYYSIYMALDYCCVVCTCPVIPVIIVIILTYISPYSMTYLILIYVIMLIISWLGMIFKLISIEHNQHIPWALIRCVVGNSWNVNKTLPDFLLITHMSCRSCIDHFVLSEGVLGQRSIVFRITG